MFTWFWQPPDRCAPRGVFCSWQLPSEVWLQVFEYLSPSERLRVRAVCKGFRDVVDCSRLWRDWTLTLRRKYVVYNQQFWRTLRRWRVSAAAVQSCPLSWERIAAELPQLHTLITNDDSPAALERLQCFSNMRRLYLRRSKGMPLHNLLALLPAQLQHLSVCDAFQNKRKCVASFMSDLNFNTAAHLTNLTSLVLHTLFRLEPKELLPKILSSFPQLMYLSVFSPTTWGVDPGVPKPPPLQHRALVTLEIIDGVNELPEDVMRMVPCVCSLALFFTEHSGVAEYSPISAWLRDLPALTSLQVIGGPPVRTFLKAIPSSVTQLALCPARTNPKELAALSSQLPHLQHLHLETATYLGPDTALIPRLFPRLRSLRLQHERVPEDAFLSLAAMPELRRLETQDSVPLPPGLAAKFRTLAQNRVQLRLRSGWDPLWTDDCISWLPTLK